RALVAHLAEDAREQRQREAALELALRGETVRGLVREARLAGVEVQGQRPHAAAALLRRGALVLVRGEALERGEEERAESSALRVGRGDRAALEQRGEEALREVLGRVAVRAPAARVGVERIPVRRAERRERLARAGAGRAARRDDDRPACGQEPRETAVVAQNRRTASVVNTH